jgi:signal transduction histidine kinase
LIITGCLLTSFLTQKKVFRMSKKLNMVIIEDEEPHFKLMERAIVKNFPHASVSYFKDASACLEKLDEITPDIIITDYLLPGMNGIEFLKTLKLKNNQIPVIMITGQGDETIAAYSIKLGAWDYIVKSADFFVLLPSVVEQVLREWSLKESLRKSERRFHVLSQQLMRTQEIERRRLSCDLHDHLAQDLSTLKIGIDTLIDNHTETSVKMKQKVSELSDMVYKTIMDVREMAYFLRPAGLDKLGLVQTVFQYCEDFSAKNNIEVDFFSVGIDGLKLDFDTEIAIYRLIQEGLNNIKKHADATHAAIRLIASFPNIILRIEDNGNGFNIQKYSDSAINGKQMGLLSMEERVSFLAGKMKIESRLKQGTKILIEIPCKELNGG